MKRWLRGKSDMENMVQLYRELRDNGENYKELWFHIYLLNYGYREDMESHGKIIRNIRGPYIGNYGKLVIDMENIWENLTSKDLDLLSR